MCGIAGLIGGPVPGGRDAVLTMQHALKHRGPNASGLHEHGSVALAHTRLSIIDLEGGDQPLFSDDGKLCLVVNGEIYNFTQLREHYSKKGYPFKTRSDCEVILPLYQQYGDACVEHLRGMFAFALYDMARNRVLIARDRMGEKPFYFNRDGNRVVFASELRALLASGLVDRDVDPLAVSQYFRYQYVPEPRTPFRSIEKLPAGCTLAIELEPWSVKLERYWSAWDAPELRDDPKVAIREALDEAVSTSMASDVPIGLSLSGGIDSSVLACLMRKHSDREIHAIGIGYRDAAGFDERPQARELAEKLGLTFHDVELEDEDMLNSFADVVSMRDDPIGDISGFNYHSIMSYARDSGIPVMFQGHGADELCWGYPWVQKAVGMNEGTHTGATEQPAWRRLANWLRGRGVPEQAAADAAFRMFDIQPYTNWVLQNGPLMFTDEFVRQSGFGPQNFVQEYGKSGLRVDLEVTRLIVEYYLLENGIAQGDRLSMANSVEMRLPFVDYRFVETVIGLRKHERDDHLPLKHWLKESVRDLLPDSVLNRPKRGFAPPVPRWQAALREKFGEQLREGHLVSQGILDPRFASRLAVHEIDNAAESIVSRLAIGLELWFDGIVAIDAKAAA